MLNKRKVVLVVPCYNEAEGLKIIFEKIPRVIDDVIIVDNNSTDASLKIARKNKAVIVKERTQGYGAAYKKGFKGLTNEVVVCMDGDGTYPIEQVENLLVLFFESNLDFLNCSRFPLKQKKDMPFLNRMGNRFLTLIFNKHYKTSISDSQSGMWIINGKILPKITPKSDGMSFSQQIKINAYKNEDVRFAEAQIGYYPRVGKAKLKVWKDGFLNLVRLFIN